PQTLAALALAPGPLVAKHSASSVALPAPVFVVEGRYDGATVEGLLPAREPWPELIDLELEPLAPRCPEPTATSLTATVSSCAATPGPICSASRRSPRPSPTSRASPARTTARSWRCTGRCSR